MLTQATKWIWKSKSTMKIEVFGWLLLSDRLNTRNMLKRRQYNIADNNDCILCGLPIEETVQYLFFNCSFSSSCRPTLHIAWQPGGSRLEKIASAKDSWTQPLFKEIFLVAAWSIWKERNKKHFSGISPSRESWLYWFREDFALLTYRVKEKHKPFLSSLLHSLS